MHTFVNKRFLFYMKKLCQISYVENYKLSQRIWRSNARRAESMLSKLSRLSTHNPRFSAVLLRLIRGARLHGEVDSVHFSHGLVRYGVAGAQHVARVTVQRAVRLRCRLQRACKVPGGRKSLLCQTNNEMGGLMEQRDCWEAGPRSVSCVGRVQGDGVREQGRGSRSCC